MVASIFVSKSGSDANPGTFERPVLTIGAAVAISLSGDQIVVGPGTYNEQVSPRTGTSLYASGSSIIDASGFSSCIEIAGKNNVLICGFEFKNLTGGVGWSNVEGVAIRDLNNVSGVGSSNITIRGCTFSDIRRKPGTDSIGIPLIIGSFANGSATNCHHIVVDKCTFLTAQSYNLQEFPIYAGAITVAGNVEELLISDCYFYHDYSLYSHAGSAIEFSANYNAPADPDYVRNAVITNNQFKYTGPYTGAGQCIYVQGGYNILVERNYIEWSLGVNIVCEANGKTHTTENILVRRNYISPVLLEGLTVGAFAPTYNNVNNIWVESNTILGGVRFVSDGVGEGGTNVLLTNNILVGTITNSFSYNPEVNSSYENKIQISNIYKSVPSWVDSFGEYDRIESDINGSKQKLTRGAYEKQWTRQIRHAKRP